MQPLEIFKIAIESISGYLFLFGPETSVTHWCPRSPRHKRSSCTLPRRPWVQEQPAAWKRGPSHQTSIWYVVCIFTCTFICNYIYIYQYKYLDIQSYMSMFMFIFLSVLWCLCLLVLWDLTWIFVYGHVTFVFVAMMFWVLCYKLYVITTSDI